ncbi:MAG: azurin [Verrucomicrobia bacterium]|nr:azurin [Verrucomicrobiota bacterium]
MNRFTPSFTALLVGACFFLAGCGPQKTETATPPAPAAAGAKVIEITAGDNMKFNLAEITAAPGEEITVALTNIGTQPKVAMGHNWVLLKKDVDAGAFATAAMQAQSTEYLPASQQDNVLAHTRLLGAKEKDKVTFKAPAEPGEYVYLCTFPAHYQMGMKGVLIVR